jgi:hypothetical protein
MQVEKKLKAKEQQLESTEHQVQALLIMHCLGHWQQQSR